MEFHPETATPTMHSACSSNSRRAQWQKLVAGPRVLILMKWTSATPLSDGNGRAPRALPLAPQSTAPALPLRLPVVHTHTRHPHHHAHSQALLEAWRAERARRPLAMSEADACSVLGVAPNKDGHVDEDDMRRAYRGCRAVLDVMPDEGGHVDEDDVRSTYSRLSSRSLLAGLSSWLNIQSLLADLEAVQLAIGRRRTQMWEMSRLLTQYPNPKWACQPVRQEVDQHGDRLATEHAYTCTC
eukprot:366246-Chlamydomonas_euryale.AAC.4